MAEPAGGAVATAAELFDLRGRTALVTGASSGLGERFAEVLGRAGAKVVCAARRTDRLEALVARIRERGGEAMAVRLDVTEPADIAAAFDAAEKAYGTVTVLVNNAGIGPQHGVLEQTAEQWRRVLDTNLDAVWFVAQEAARRMAAAQTPGTVVNIASILGFGTAKTLSAYAVAKAAVVQLTRAMALELAEHAIRVNAIAPGYIRTEINSAFFDSERGQKTISRIPQKRIGTPGDLDGTLLLLASDASSFMTGTTVVVDGGHLLPLVG